VGGDTVVLQDIVIKNYTREDVLKGENPPVDGLHALFGGVKQDKYGIDVGFSWKVSIAFRDT